MTFGEVQKELQLELEAETITDLEPSQEEADEVAGGSQRCQLPRPEGGGAWSG